MKKRYNIVDFGCLVSDWYNECLPRIAYDNVGVVEDAGILYMANVKLNKAQLAESIKFIADRAKSIVDSSGGIGIFVRSPKAVSNPWMHGFLKFIENPKNGISESNITKIFHIANQRYIASSKDILIAQDKEIDSFLDSAWNALKNLNLKCARFYGSECLPFKDVCEVARQFFPKSSIFINEKCVAPHIKVASSNDVLTPICNRWGNKSQNPCILEFISKAKKNAMKDFEKLI